LAEIEATNDLARMRQVIEQYVRQIAVETREIEPRKKHADVRIFLRLEPASIAVENATASRSGLRSLCAAFNPPEQSIGAHATDHGRSVVA
jgi:hypothetical protein